MKGCWDLVTECEVSCNKDVLNGLLIPCTSTACQQARLSSFIQGRLNIPRNNSLFTPVHVRGPRQNQVAGRLVRNTPGDRSRNAAGAAAPAAAVLLSDALSHRHKVDEKRLSQHGACDSAYAAAISSCRTETMSMPYPVCSQRLAMVKNHQGMGQHAVPSKPQLPTQSKPQSKTLNQHIFIRGKAHCAARSAAAACTGTPQLLLLLLLRCVRRRALLLQWWRQCLPPYAAGQ